jgi:hypothetical protein
MREGIFRESAAAKNITIRKANLLIRGYEVLLKLWLHLANDWRKGVLDL